MISSFQASRTRYLIPVPAIPKYARVYLEQNNKFTNIRLLTVQVFEEPKKI
jgi:hypothetical protein